MLLLNLLPPPQDLLPADAERFIAAAVAEAEALRVFDGQLFPLTDDPAAWQRCRHVRAEWLRWADEAQPLYDALEQTPGIDKQSLRPLYVLIAHARMLLRQSPEEIKRRHERVRAGDYITGEDLRRELGIPRRR